MQGTFEAEGVRAIHKLGSVEDSRPKRNKIKSTERIENEASKISLSVKSRLSTLFPILNTVTSCPMCMYTSQPTSQLLFAFTICLRRSSLYLSAKQITQRLGETYLLDVCPADSNGLLWALLALPEALLRRSVSLQCAISGCILKCASADLLSGCNTTCSSFLGFLLAHAFRHVLSMLCVNYVRC
jgi:hypothetical protein